MIKKEYAVAAVLDFLRQDDRLIISEEAIAQYVAILMEAQAFTMRLEDLLTLIDEKSAAADDMEEEIRAELPFPAVYIEYTHCSKYSALEDVDRCCIFAVGNPENEARPIIYMTIHYLNGTQLCPSSAVYDHGQTLVELSSDVMPHQREFVKEQTEAMVVFTGTLMEAITNGGVREYLPSTMRRKMYSKRNKKHKLLEYKMLKLDLHSMSNQQEPGGGTHASPRLHLRRGHWRKYRDGHKKWIKPMWVGDKDLGVVHKDYEVVNHG